MYLFSFNANIYPPPPLCGHPTTYLSLSPSSTSHLPFFHFPTSFPLFSNNWCTFPFPPFHILPKVIVGQACYFFPPTASGLVQILPRKRRARSMSLGMILTRFACTAHRIVSSNMPTIYASQASWRAKTAKLWKRRSLWWNKFCVISRTRSWKGAFLINSLKATDLTKGNGPWAVTMRLLHSTLWTSTATSSSSSSGSG